MTQQENYNVCRSLKKVKGAKASQLDTQYMPVPYNIDFELYILSKQSDDALQIVSKSYLTFRSRLYSNYQ